jgi:mRNA-degrading endonuclease toxin of MazEF toxin-antitoxin module
VIDQNHPNWSASGLRLDSAIRCDRLFTVAHANIHRKIGQLSAASQQQIEDRLKVAFGIR